MVADFRSSVASMPSPMRLPKTLVRISVFEEDVVVREEVKYESMVQQSNIMY